MLVGVRCRLFERVHSVPQETYSLFKGPGVVKLWTRSQEGAVWLEEGSQVEEIKTGDPVTLKL